MRASEYENKLKQQAAEATTQNVPSSSSNPISFGPTPTANGASFIANNSPGD